VFFVGKTVGFLGLLVVIILLGILFLAVLSTTLEGGGYSASFSPPVGAIYGGDNAVTLAAKAMAAHLNSSCLTQDRNPDCLGDASFDSGFPQAILQWGMSQCPGCRAWMSDHFQCVSFVLGAYGLFHPLDFSENGDGWYARYAAADAVALGYRELLPAQGQLPMSPGDVMAWGGGAHGHVSIVLGWIPPANGKNGSLTFAQANGEKPIQTLPILPDGTVDTHDGYWNGFVVEAYIHPAWLPVVAPSVVSTQRVQPGNLPKSPYVAIAQEDATLAGIDPNIYVRQINQESGFNPNAISPAGAIGIAQFMPATAAGLGVDPHDPNASLRAAALLMSRLLANYQGDYAKALAAYNAGGGAVQSAVSRCGTNWLSCVPNETQRYVAVILGS